MDTLEFLKALLPEEGIKFVARWFDVPNHPRKGIFMHKPFVDLDDMADNIKWHASKGNTVYHACATFKEVKYITTKAGKEVPAGRTKDNALAARALWFDFDVGKEAAHSYTSKREVVDCLGVMIKQLALPVPMVVDSGNGVHAYFLIEEALPRSQWDALALKFRAVSDAFGLKYDPSRSSDISSVLRPPGTYNLKDPTNPKPVTVKREGTRMPAAFYDGLFQAYLDEHGIVPVAPVAKNDFGGLNSDLITKVEYPASSAAVIAQHCQQVRQFSESGGHDEPTWYAMLGLLKHCTDGEQLAHEWSAKYEAYDQGETQAKLDHWEYGPSTCDKFRQVNAAGCAGCEKTCKSPIQLGYTVPENVTHTPFEVEEDDTPQELLQVGPGSEFWPAGYRVANGRIDVTRENEDGTVGFVQLCSPPFWVLSEVRSETGEFMLHMRAEVTSSRYHDFDIPTASTSSADKLKSALAANRIYVLNNSTKAGYEIMNLVQQQSLAMQRKREEINTFTQMGWNADKTAFLMGDSLVTANGIQKVRVAKSITNIGKGDHALEGSMQTKGTLEEYRDGVMHLYGGEGQEVNQYILGAALGAYLAPFVNNSKWHGIPLAVYSSRSSYGKTTVAAIGLNAMLLNTKSMSSDGTLNSFKKMLSTYGSLPVFFDELTDKIKASEQKDLLYNWSLGMDRMRLNQDGSMRERVDMWCNMGITTTNKSVLFKLTEDSTDPEATQVRIMEVDLAEYLPGKPGKENQKLATHLETNVYGVATERFLRMVAKNKEKIEELIESEFHAVTSTLPDDAATTCRYLCYHAACSLVGLKLGKKLGLWEFSVTSVRAFVARHIRRQLEKITQYRVSPEDRFAAMMADFNGRLLVTYRFDTLDARKKPAAVEEPLVRVNGNIVGRFALGAAGTKSEVGDSGRLYVTISAINEWCRRHELNAAEVRKEWRDAGLLETERGADGNGERLVKLGRGVPAHALPPARCVEFKLSRIQDVVPDAIIPKAEVVPITRASA